MQDYKPTEEQLVPELFEHFSQKLDFVISELSSVKSDTYGMNHKLYTVSQFAKKLGMAPGTIYNKINQNKIPFLKIGGSIRFTEEHLNQILRGSVN